MRHYIKIALLFLTVVSCRSQVNQLKDKRQKKEIEKEISESSTQPESIKTGADNYTAYLPLLKDCYG